MTERELSRAPALNTPDNIENDHMLQARSVARRLGISTRTLERWIKSAHIAFPGPDRVTNDVLGRPANRFWWKSTVVSWEANNSRPSPGRPVKTEEAA